MRNNCAIYIFIQSVKNILTAYECDILYTLSIEESEYYYSLLDYIKTLSNKYKEYYSYISRKLTYTELSVYIEKSKTCTTRGTERAVFRWLNKQTAKFKDDIQKQECILQKQYGVKPYYTLNDFLRSKNEKYRNKAV